MARRCSSDSRFTDTLSDTYLPLLLGCSWSASGAISVPRISPEQAPYLLGEVRGLLAHDLERVDGGVLDERLLVLDFDRGAGRVLTIGRHGCGLVKREKG